MSNFIDLEVAPTDYSGYSIFSLLFTYWEICKELITIRELINIDHIRDISRISICGQGLRNIESVLQEKWTSNLPPLYVVLLKYSQHKFIYNPKRFEKREYSYFLMGKKHRLERELQRMERVNEQRNRRNTLRRSTVVRRGCLRL